MDELPTIILGPLKALGRSRKAVLGVTGLLVLVASYYIPNFPTEIGWAAAGVLSLVIPLTVAYEDGAEKRAKVVATLETELEDALNFAGGEVIPLLKAYTDTVKADLEEALEELEPEELNTEVILKLLESIADVVIPATE